MLQEHNYSNQLSGKKRNCSNGFRESGREDLKKTKIWNGAAEETILLAVPNVSCDISRLISQFASPLPTLQRINWSNFHEMLSLNDFSVNIFKRDFSQNKPLIENCEVDTALQEPSLRMLSEMKSQVLTWTKSEQLEAEIVEHITKAKAETEDYIGKEQEIVTVFAYQPNSKHEREAGHALVMIVLKGFDVCSALLLVKEDRYIIVSCEGFRPHVQTPDFEYVNSNGYGPRIDLIETLKRLDGSSTHEQIFTNLSTFFQEFCVNIHYEYATAFVMTK
jgi:hypothetical protein